MNLVEGLTKLANSNQAQKLFMKMAGHPGLALDANQKVQFLMDNLKEKYEVIQDAAKEIGWELLLNNGQTVKDNLEYVYEQWIPLIQQIAVESGYDIKDISPEVERIPQDLESIEVVEKDHLIGEWHFSVGYKEIHLFSMCLLPLLEEEGYAIVCDNAAEIIELETIGYEANPYVVLESKADLVSFLRIFFANADIKKYYEDEIAWRKSCMFQFAVGPWTEEGTKIVDEYVSPLLIEAGFQRVDTENNSFHFIVSLFDEPRAREIVNKCKEQYPFLFWSASPLKQ